MNTSSQSALRIGALRATTYQPFPTDSPPGPVREFVVQASAALDCDAAAVALPGLAAMAGLVGNTRVLELKSTWVEPCVLWTAVIGEPGTRKSAALQQATGFLVDHQRRMLTL